VLRGLGLLTLAGGAAATLGVGWPAVARTDPEEGVAGRGRRLDAAAWRTVAAWTETLFPSGPGSPGATDVNAVGYVDAVTADPDFSPRDAATLLDGVRRLDELARARAGRAFASLAPEERDAVLVALSREPEGGRAIRLALVLTLEAALGDPLYGGNPGGAGWAWIGYEPPRPRPTAPWRAGKRG
jgi:gluconate 2-dehydrogenase gamma chain